ncbi:amino acid ABC transporter substrate-binding protein [Clostridium botulinum]|uniref:Amino acid ABC transporter substrate-binding protein n=1 Tax=Clostridium botulinum C/D str. DC5 TaxID=1443128 RepID=A0A0A0IEV7_CLOBO|nr:ABC transporter substrate-binding protein [Clostridium botulinum]KEI00232.1 amino acid ABC transporter substrate-binding protein [Clostridium botulinum C/D str. BKT75002]KEI07011.1 amino acid ABC transporter substrate-binding protein [Clostridium botulinum C/D str. BKT2873]KGM94911.1 amino acid ABC transporter substrate-binding protein [Clostridium botulinum D str. CCUG 7971]KGM99058.1 amino acid ABC transporter substrate-binding protein [Clostridium botulinum C/D str. DC5]KOC55167.1 amino 
MKKIISFVLITTMGLMLLSGCSSSKPSLGRQSGEDNSLKCMKSSGKLRIGLDDSYPPMEFRDEKNNLIGFDIDLSNEIAKKLGVKVEFVTAEFSGILLGLQSKKFDAIIAGFSITEDRKKFVNFSEPYVLGGQVIAVKKGNTSIKKLSDLKYKIVGCQMGSNGQHCAEKNLKDIKELRKYSKIPQAFSDMAIGRIDAVIMDAQVGGYYLSKNPGEFQVLNEMVVKQPMGIAFKMGDNALKNEVQKIVNDLKKEGILSKLSLKWFGFDAYKDK